MGHMSEYFFPQLCVNFPAFLPTLHLRKTVVSKSPTIFMILRNRETEHVSSQKRIASALVGLNSTAARFHPL